MKWLRRTVEYDRPWVGRVGLALILVLWLFLTVVGFAVGVSTGIAFLVGGAALIAGEVWIERSGAQHPRFVLVWRLAWRIGVGVAVIVVGVTRADGWDTALASIFGAWLILSGVLLATARWLEARRPAARNDE